MNIKYFSFISHVYFLKVALSEQKLLMNNKKLSVPENKIMPHYSTTEVKILRHCIYICVSIYKFEHFFIFLLEKNQRVLEDVRGAVDKIPFSTR